MGRVYNTGSAQSGSRQGKTPGPSAWKKPKGPNVHKCNWTCSQPSGKAWTRWNPGVFGSKA